MNPPLSDDDREDLARIAAALLNPQEGANPNGPIASPPDRFGHLPEHVRKFIAGWREEDVTDWQQALAWFRAVRVVIRFFKSLGVALGSAFAATAAAVTAYKFFKGG